MARHHGTGIEGVQLPQAKRGFALLSRLWVVERSFAWATRFRRLVEDYKRLLGTIAGLHMIAFACPMMKTLIDSSIIYDSLQQYFGTFKLMMRGEGADRNVGIA